MKNEKLNLTPKRNKNLTELKKKYDLNENSFKKMPTRYSVIPNFIFPPKKKKRDFKNDDLEILNHSKNIEGILNNGEELFNIPFEITEKEENLMKYCVSKRRNLRKKEENIFIAHYISTFKNYRNIIINKDEKFIDPNEFLIRISQNLIQENVNSFNLINRFGDKNVKFYMILEGKISVLSIKESVYKMNEIEYINHLQFLLEIKENELVNKILEKNDKIFNAENIKKILKGEIDLNEEQKQLIKEHEKLNEFDISHVIPKQYIKRFIPELNTENDYNKKEVTLFIYEITNELSNGETFGESALINDLIIKNTYITTEETILLFLHKKIFDKCEREAQFKLRKNNIEIILNNELFKRMNSEIFDKKYFDLFKILSKKQGNILFSQGEERKEIFFIKKGTISITSNLNYNELNKIIIEKGGILDEKLEQKMLKKNSNLPDNLLSYQNIFQIFQINNNEILGMDDYVLTKNNIFFCNAIVTSKYLDLYSIDLNLFIEMCQNDFRINEIYDYYLNKRNEIMVERLIHLKKVLLNKEIERISRNKTNIKKTEINFENNEINENKISLFKNFISNFILFNC
jgi:CRP-like cAMP-binding protein